MNARWEFTGDIGSAICQLRQVVHVLWVQRYARLDVIGILVKADAVRCNDVTHRGDIQREK